MAVPNKIFIPTFISSVTYQPVRTLPHIYFYNGLKDCEPYFIEHYQDGSTSVVENTQQEKFPYFDYYDGLEPTTGSNSLLFFNETPPYGVTPTGSLYTNYWSKYVSLLYNPRTRLINASGIIPLADYFVMELNDIVQWRGNYYHLRAINDYNLKDGTCKLQLLGPILDDTLTINQLDCSFDFDVFAPPTTSTTLSPTTTVYPGPCTRYAIETTGANTGYWNYTDCQTGVVTLIGVPAGQTRYVCSRTTPTFSSGGIGYTYSQGPCNIITTTTISPTTSTTLSPTTSTTTLTPTTSTTASPTTSTTMGPTTTTDAPTEITQGFNSQYLRSSYLSGNWESTVETNDEIIISGTGITLDGNSVYFPETAYGVGPNLSQISLAFGATGGTLEAWIMVYEQGDSDKNAIVGWCQQRQYEPQYWFIGLDQNTYDIYSEINDGSSEYQTGRVTLTPEIWYHVVATYDAINDIHKLYVNGLGVSELSEVITWSSFDNFGQMAVNRFPLGYPVGNPRPGINRIGRIRQYQTALTPVQVATNYVVERSIYSNLTTSTTLAPTTSTTLAPTTTSTTTQGPNFFSLQVTNNTTESIDFARMTFEGNDDNLFRLNNIGPSQSDSTSSIQLMTRIPGGNDWTYDFNVTGSDFKQFQVTSSYSIDGFTVGPNVSNFIGTGSYFERIPPFTNVTFENNTSYSLDMTINPLGGQFHDIYVNFNVLNENSNNLDFARVRITLGTPEDEIRLNNILSGTSASLSGIEAINVDFASQTIRLEWDFEGTSIVDFDWTGSISYGGVFPPLVDSGSDFNSGTFSYILDQKQLDLVTSMSIDLQIRNV